MRMQLKIGWNVIFDCAFHRFDGFTRCDTGAIADAENVRVNGLGRVFPPHVQNDVGRFAPHTGSDCKAAREQGTSPP